MWTCKKSNQFEPAEIKGFRALDSGNIVVVFQDADVIVPGNWNFPEEFGVPEVGQKWSAYWSDELNADTGETRRRLHIARDLKAETAKKRR